MDNTFKVYFDNFFEVARKNEKNIYPGMLPRISKLGHMPKTAGKQSTELHKRLIIEQNTFEGRKRAVIRKPTLWVNFTV